MKTRFLFPHQFRLIGVVLLAIAAILCGINQYVNDGIFNTTDLKNLDPIPTDVWLQIIYNGALQVSIVLGLLFVGFSKEKVEDEHLAQLRLDSLQWAIYVNYALFILCIIFVYGWTFFSVTLYNIITPLLFFIIRFRWTVFQSNRLLKTEGLAA